MNKLWSIFIFCCLFTMPVHSQENNALTLFGMSLEDLMNVKIESSTFFKTPAKKSPGYSYVIDLKKNALTSSRTLGDIIGEQVPGMVVGEHPDLGTTIGVRGIQIDANNKTLIMVDGEILNQRMHHGYMSGLKMPLLGDYSSLEVILGPSAIMHGSGSINGLINLIPKNGHDNKGLMANIEYGIREKLGKAEVGYGFDFGKSKNLFVYAGIYYADGFKPDTTVYKQYSYKSYADKAYFNRKPCFKISSSFNYNNFNLNFLYQDLNEARFKDNINRFYKNQAIMAVKGKYNFILNEKENLEINGSTEFIDFGLESDDKLVLKGGSENHFEIKPVFRTVRFSKNQLAAGGLFSVRNFYQMKQFFREDYKSDWDAANAAWKEYGLFAEDIFQASPKITVSCGVRYDIVTYDNGNEPTKHFSPRFATSYELNPSTIFRASYQEGYRTPDALFPYRLSTDLKILNTAAPGHNFSLTLKPETMENIELNIHKDFKNKKIQFDINGFYNTLKNTLGFINMTLRGNVLTEEYFPAYAIDSVDRYLGAKQTPPLTRQGWWGTFANNKSSYSLAGGEFIVGYYPEKSTSINFSYGYTKYVNASFDAVKYPFHLFKFSAIQTIYKILNINVILNANPGMDYTKYSMADTYGKWRVVLDANLNLTINKYISFYASAKNLTGNKIPYPCYIQNDLYTSYQGYNKRFYYLGMKFNL